MNPIKKLTSKTVAIICIQVAVAIYSFAGVAGKFASVHTFLSWGFLLFYGLEILCLGIYAILWQQIIKRFELSVAYVNRAMSLLWSLVWSVLLFKEHISVQNVLGVIIVVGGVILVNVADKEMIA
jgi:drug/metabolite transporter (DMT)-like permease